MMSEPLNGLRVLSWPPARAQAQSSLVLGRQSFIDTFDLHAPQGFL